MEVFLWQVGKLYDGLCDSESATRLPSMLSVCVLDVILAKAHLTLDSLFGNTDEDPDLTQIVQTARDLVPTVLGLIPVYQKFAR